MSFSGIVIHGKELGRTIGYPTANIALGAGTVADGVYALHIITSDGMDYLGVGTYRENISLFEAHLFNFSGDLYDHLLTIEILGTIRDNQKFNSLDELKTQIQKDATMAKTFAF
jgi:riboflavin kinase / FMN adenylyltransferase